MIVFYFIFKGTTKRKELHGTTKVLSMSGSWGSDRSVTKLQGYKLNFVCDQVGQKYSDFILLIDANIAKEAATLDIDLYLHDKMVKASVSPCGPLELDARQVWSNIFFTYFVLDNNFSYMKYLFWLFFRWNKQNYFRNFSLTVCMENCLLDQKHQKPQGSSFSRKMTRSFGIKKICICFYLWILLWILIEVFASIGM